MVKRIFNPDGNQSGRGNRPPRRRFSGNGVPTFETRRRSRGNVRTASEPAPAVSAVISNRDGGRGGDRAGGLSFALPAFTAGKIARQSSRMVVPGRAQPCVEESHQSSTAVAGRSGRSDGSRTGSRRTVGGTAETGSSAGGGEGAAGIGPVLSFAAGRRSAVPGNCRSAGNFVGGGGELARKIFVAAHPGRRMQEVSCRVMII